MSGFEFNFNGIQHISTCQELLSVWVRKTAIESVLRAWRPYAPKAGTFPFQASSQDTNVQWRFIGHSFWEGYCKLPQGLSRTLTFLQSSAPNSGSQVASGFGGSSYSSCPCPHCPAHRAHTDVKTKNSITVEKGHFPINSTAVSSSSPCLTVFLHLICPHLIAVSVSTPCNFSMSPKIPTVNQNSSKI